MDSGHHSVISGILNSYTPVSPGSLDSVIEAGAIQFYQKNEIIFPAKKYNAFEYFQMEGISHRFVSDDEGNEITTGIYCNTNVITPHFARTRNGQSIFSLHALTDCTF